MAFKMKGPTKKGRVTKKTEPHEYPEGKSRWWQNLKYKVTKNVKHLKK